MRTDPRREPDRASASPRSAVGAFDASIVASTSCGRSPARYRM
jgi:hypothetical protein